MADKGVLTSSFVRIVTVKMSEIQSEHTNICSVSLQLILVWGLTTRLCVKRHHQDPNPCSQSSVCSHPPLKPLHCFCRLRSLSTSSHKLCTEFGKSTRRSVPCHVGHRSFSLASACRQLSLSILVTTSPIPCSRGGCMV